MAIGWLAAGGVPGCLCLWVRSAGLLQSWIPVSGRLDMRHYWLCSMAGFCVASNASVWRVATNVGRSRHPALPAAAD